MRIVTIDASCEAKGHPTECEEPVDGTVEATSSHNITNTDASGNTREIATVDSANIHFDSHAHTYDGDSCVDNESHDLDPDASAMPNITINGAQVYVVDDAVTTDPTSGGDVDIVDAGFNNSIESK